MDCRLFNLFTGFPYKNLSIPERNEYWERYRSGQEDQFENTVGISKLGCVNCDIFFGPGYPSRTDLLVKLPNVDFQQTKFYVYLPNINSMLNCRVNQREKLAKVSAIPRTEKVVIVGFRIKDEQTFVSKTEGTVSQLQQQAINDFRPYSLKELKSIF